MKKTATGVVFLRKEKEDDFFGSGRYSVTEDVEVSFSVLRKPNPLEFDILLTDPHEGVGEMRLYGEKKVPTAPDGIGLINICEANHTIPFVEIKFVVFKRQNDRGPYLKLIKLRGSKDFNSID